jgi:pilus assembly protein CpaE
MYPLKPILVGCDDDLLPHVRRELSNLGVDPEGEFHDARRAVDTLYATRTQPRLFILNLASVGDLSHLRRLSSTFLGQPILALIKGKNPDALIATQRAGAVQVVPLPLDPGDFRLALDCIGMQFGFGAAATCIIAVSGVTGGCGATSVAINLAYEIAQQYQRPTILAELSAQVGMLAAYLNFEPKYTLYDLLKHAAGIDSYMVKNALVSFADHLQVLAGPNRVITDLQVTADDIARLLEHSRRLAEVIVLDVPATYTDLYFATLAASDQVVVVGEQKIPSVRNLKLTLESLAGAGLHSHHVLINRYDPNRKGFALEALRELLRFPELRPIANDEENLSAALSEGRPLRLQAPRSPVLADIDNLACSLIHVTEDSPAAARPKANFLGQLASVFGIS